jgi:1,2-phenylacetyl-CoA epoxidase catalytic subunit
MSPTVTTSYQRFGELEPEVGRALLSWILSLADTKHRVGIRTSEWVNGGPALEAAVGASAITQDELGHARSLYAMLKDFPDVPAGIGAENDLEARDIYYCPRPLGETWPSWLDVIAANVLLDRATNIAVAAGRASTFGPLRGRTAKILQEEKFHRIFGDSWLAKLAGNDNEHRARLQASLDHFGQIAVAWFGPDDDKDAALLKESGILNKSLREMRAQWLDELIPLLGKNELALPNLDIDWTGWDKEYRDITV